MDNNNNNNILLEELLIEIKKLKSHNNILSEQINIAIQGLEVIISMGDSMNESVATQTVKAMEKCEEDSSQDKETE